MEDTWEPNQEGLDRYKSHLSVSSFVKHCHGNLFLKQWPETSTKLRGPFYLHDQTSKISCNSCPEVGNCPEWNSDHFFFHGAMDIKLIMYYYNVLYIKSRLFWLEYLGLIRILFWSVSHIRTYIYTLWYFVDQTTLSLFPCFFHCASEKLYTVCNVNRIWTAMFYELRHKVSHFSCPPSSENTSMKWNIETCFRNYWHNRQCTVTLFLYLNKSRNIFVYLERLTVSRNVPSIKIVLSKIPLDVNEPGYVTNLLSALENVNLNLT